MELSLYQITFGLLLAIVGCQQIQFDSVERKINLNSHKVYSEYKITLRNTGTPPVNEFQFILKNDQCNKLYFMDALSSGVQIQIKPSNFHETQKYCYFTVKLTNSIETNATHGIDMNLVFSHRFSPQPEEVGQNQDHSFTFTDNFYIDSLYFIKSQKTTISIPKNRIISHSNDSSISVTSNEIRIGPIEHVHPFSDKTLFILFKHPGPLFVIEKMLVSYQISELGMIKVMNEFWVKNEAANLTGPYSRRFDLQGQSDPHSVTSWNMKIPSNAYNIIYRDGLGNISTSEVFRENSNLVLRLIPRFPIFGGWKTYYYVSYLLSPENFLYLNENNKRHFIFDLFGDPMADYLIQESEIHILLPEKAFNIDIKFSGLDINVDQSISHSYLDYYGRKTYILRNKRACVEKNIPIEIVYQFSPISLVIKPLIVSVAIFVLMVTLQIFSSLRIPVLRTSADDTKDRRSSLVDRVVLNSNTIKDLINDCLQAIVLFKGNKDVSKLNQTRAAINQKIEYASHQINLDMASLKSIDNSLSKTFDHYSHADTERQMKLKKYEQLSRNLVDGEITRENYSKEAKPIEEEIQIINTTIDVMMRTI